MACGALYIDHGPRAVAIINVRRSTGPGGDMQNDIRAALLSRHILARPVILIINDEC